MAMVLLALAAAAGSAAANETVAAAEAAAGEPRTAEALAAAHQRRFQAMVGRDLEALAPLLADELVYTHSSGKAESKAEFLATLESGALRYLAIVSEGESPLHLLADGEVALITGGARVRVRVGGEQGEEGEVVLRYTSVYVHRDGRWQLAAWHSSAVRSP